MARNGGVVACCIVDDLDARVTDAILRAEARIVGSLESWQAFHEVGLLEEAIANQTAPDQLEGAAARQSRRASLQ